MLNTHYFIRFWLGNRYMNKHEIHTVELGLRDFVDLVGQKSLILPPKIIQFPCFERRPSDLVLVNMYASDNDFRC